MALVDRHLRFVQALRDAGVEASLAEALDAVSALGLVGWHDRDTVRQTYAATMVKKQSQRPTFDILFDLWFPALVGEGITAQPYEDDRGRRDSLDQLTDVRERVAEALLRATSIDPAEAAQSQAESDSLAVEAMGRFGRMPGRAQGQQGWSAYNAMRRVGAEEIVQKIADALRAAGVAPSEARARAQAAMSRFEAAVQADALRRIAAERDPGDVARTTVRPTIEKVDFTAARREDLVEMRRVLTPLARRLAARLTREQRSRRRGPLDFRRTVRASMSTGGVPLETFQRPRRPHRTELVVLCDVSGSVANFAQFTLMLVFALREQFTGVRAFTFVDDVHEVTDVFRPGSDPGDVLTELAERSAHAARFGRTNYGAAFAAFAEKYPDALGPRTTLLVLGDARSNYADLNEQTLRSLVAGVRRAIWLNPEHPRHWGAGDSAVPVYEQVVPMTECRNLEQLGAFVHDLV